MAQRLSVLAALAEDLFGSQHLYWWLTTASNSSFGGSDTFF